MKGRRCDTSLASSNYPSTRPSCCLMVRPSRITPGFCLPRPVYRAPWYAHALRRRGGTVRPRSPFIHFSLDCILQRKITFVDKFNFGRISKTLRSIWYRMTCEQRRPWIRMAEQDVRMLSRKHSVHRLVLGNVRRSHGGRRGVSRRRCDTTEEPAAPSDSSWLEEDTTAENNAAVDWQCGRCGGSHMLSISSPELPFLEVHRQRYSTPERSTYSLEESSPESCIPE